MQVISEQNEPFDPAKVQNDFFAITRTDLPLDQAKAVANAIQAETTTETKYVDGLLSNVENTTYPAVAVEASMYGPVGSSDEITKLATVFLPDQVHNAIENGLNPQVYACEALGLAFAFSNETGATTFAADFGPSNPAIPATAVGDGLFAALAANVIFGMAQNANTPVAIAGFVANWKAFYTSNGLPGISHATADQIDLAARGAAWGDAVGVALADNLGVLPGQVTNFLKDAAHGTAIYSAPLASQPTAGPFQGGEAAATAAISEVQLTGVAVPYDHTFV